MHITLKFIVDECVGSGVAKWLRENGHDVISIIDAMKGSKDFDILTKAYSENRVIITSDKDFGDLVFNQKQAHAGIILIRLQEASIANKIKVLENLFNLHSQNLTNNFIVLTEANTRIIRTL